MSSNGHAKDMSGKCDLAYIQMWTAMHNGEITHEQFRAWYIKHCAECIHMSEICMHGET